MLHVKHNSTSALAHILLMDVMPAENFPATVVFAQDGGKAVIFDVTM